jgi:1-pyrroline-5-carboxylate dehydrogenase
MGAVIDANSFKTQKTAIDEAKASSDAKILVGGEYDDSVGYFVRPTIIQTTNPGYRTLCDELFGPVLTLHVYDESKWLETLDLVDRTSPYALTGAIFAQDRYAIEQGLQALRNSAGNFYINDKPTGAVVGQQPFGGARASGTNDKAGSILNLQRWVSPRTIKETFAPPTDYRYAFRQGEGER